MGLIETRITITGGNEYAFNCHLSERELDHVVSMNQKYLSLCIERRKRELAKAEAKANGLRDQVALAIRAAGLDDA